MSNNKFSTGKTGTGIYGVGAQKNTGTPEAYEEYLSTPAAKAPLHGFFAVYRMRTPDGVHTTKKKPCNKYGHTKEVDAKTRTETGGVNLFTSTAADLMDVYNSPRKSAVIANIRRSITYGAEKRQEEAWENEYHAMNGALQTEVMDMPAALQSAAWEVEAEAEKASAEAGAELEYLQTVEISLLLGRRFDASIDGIIALDCDGHHPSEDFDTEALYREVSASGTGTHILYRVPKDLIPDTSGNKIKSTIDGHEYELFYGQGNGLAISGVKATANPDAPTLNMESPAGRIITQLIHSGGGGGRPATFPTTRTRAGKEPQTSLPEPEQEEPARLSPFEKHIIGIFEKSEKWKIETDMTPEKIKAKLKNPNDASAAFLRVCDWIAIDAALEAAYGIPYHHIATAERIRRLWETSQIYRDEYASGKHEYNESKIKNTIEKAIILGREKYEEELRRRGRR